MDDQLYNVVFRGEILMGCEPGEVKAKLAGLFKTTPEKVEELFSGKPMVIANRVDGHQAQRYRDAFEKAGARCEICSLEENDPAKAEMQESAEGRSSGAPYVDKAPCPKCGARLTESPECPECGIIVEKYLARQSRERQGAEIPPVEMVAAAATGSRGIGTGRKSLIFLLVAVLVAVAGFVFWKLQPDNPPKDRLLEVANRMIANMEAYGSVIEKTDDYSKTRDFVRSGQAQAADQFVGGMSLLQFEQVVKLSNEEAQGKLSVKNIEAALQSANMVEDIRKSNEAIQAEMEKLKDAAKGCNEEFKPLISGLQGFYDLYTRFTDLALAPGKQKTLASYCGTYMGQKFLVATAFDAWVNRLNQVKDPPASHDRWAKEYDTALAGIRKLKE